jgi:hypothetical protein
MIRIEKTEAPQGTYKVFKDSYDAWHSHQNVQIPYGSPWIVRETVDIGEGYPAQDLFTFSLSPSDRLDDSRKGFTPNSVRMMRVVYDRNDIEAPEFVIKTSFDVDVQDKVYDLERRVVYEEDPEFEFEIPPINQRSLFFATRGIAVRFSP